jgi:hypothetical protein
MNWTKFFKWLGQVASAIVVFGAIISVIIYVAHSETSDVRHDVAGLKDDLNNLKTELKSTNDRIDAVLSQALLKLLPASGFKGKPIAQNLIKSQEIITIAKTVNAKLQPSVIKQYGDKALALSKDPSLSPIAWRSVTQAVTYRSFLNADFTPKLTDLTPWPENDSYRTSVNTQPDETTSTPAWSFTVYWGGGYVAEEQSARLEVLAHPQRHGSQVGFFVIEGGRDFIVLDGMYMKNVILRNARVIYKGGPVKLEHVSFVNCTFELPESQPTRRFSETMLQATSISFSNGFPG